MYMNYIGKTNYLHLSIKKVCLETLDRYKYYTRFIINKLCNYQKGYIISLVSLKFDWINLEQ